MILAGAAMMTACDESDFLDNKPQGVMSEDILNSAEGVDQLVTAAYAALTGPNPQDWSVWWTPTTNWTFGEVRGDNAYKGGGGTGDGNDAHRMEVFTVDATNGQVDGKWYHLYTSVQRCNSALKVLANCSESDVPAKAVRIAEMKALRAHYYFELSRLFNQIVWIDETMDEQAYATEANNKYSRNEILELIAKDFADAAEVLPDAQGEIGRVNKWMAKAYLAKVHLYRAYEQDAQHKVVNINKDELQKVVSLCEELKGTGKYGLLDDFQQLDLVEYENGRESVWAVQYSMNDGSASAGRINWSNLLNAPQGPYSGDGFFLPSQDLINAYQTDANGLPLLDGSWQNADYDVITFEGEQPINNQVDATVDPRLDFVVGRPNVRWKTYTETPCLATWVRDRGTYGYHCCKRFFVSPESPKMYPGWPWGASELNWQIIRYADILLWESEALVELGRQDEARPLVNEIRRRAKQSAWVTAFEGEHCPNFNGYAANYKIEEYPATGWTQDYARKAVRFETRLEKAMEGERFFDLVRWGIAAETMNKYIECEKDNRVYYGEAQFVEGRDEYFPLTDNQFKFSGNTYVQNPGYASFQ